LARALARPDLGLVDPAFLRRLLLSVTWEEGNLLPAGQVEATARWLSATAKLGRRTGMETTIVVIPPAELADDRLREMWSSYGDIRTGARYYAEATERLHQQLGDQVDWLDLQSALTGTRGTYLSADGHWSRTGTELAASRLSERFAQAAPTTQIP
jgi:hypothetical protein